MARFALLLLSCVLVLPAGAQPPRAEGLALRFIPPSVPGREVIGRVTIGQPAPEAGLTIALSSSTPAAIVPPRVVIPADGTEATFTVESGWIPEPTRVQIVASMVGRTYVSATGTLTLPASGVASLTFDPPNVVGGAPSVGTLFLNAPAPAAGITAQLAVVDPDSPSKSCSPVPTVPATVRVAGGEHRVTFPIATSPSWHEMFELRASYASTTASAPLRVTKPWIKELKVPSRIKGGTTAEVVVVLAGPALPSNCGIKYRLASSDPQMAQVPADIELPTGKAEAAFPMTTSKVPTPYGLTLTVTAFYYYMGDAAYAETKEVGIALTPW
jgi:hypothetical protein